MNLLNQFTEIMAVRQLKDVRWICYFRKGGKFKRVHFGRGADGRAEGIIFPVNRNIAQAGNKYCF